MQIAFSPQVVIMRRAANNQEIVIYPDTGTAWIDTMKWKTSKRHVVKEHLLEHLPQNALLVRAVFLRVMVSFQGKWVVQLTLTFVLFAVMAIESAALMRDIYGDIQPLLHYLQWQLKGKHGFTSSDLKHIPLTTFPLQIIPLVNILWHRVSLISM